MGLAPEFFVLLGIDIFLGMSLLCALLDRDFPSRLQYLFQAAGLVGLAELFLNMGTSGRGLSDPIRFWINIIYLSTALATIIGLDIYLAAIKRKLTLATTFTGAVTVPAVMISVFFVYSYTMSGGDVSFNLTSATIIATTALGSGLSVLGFLRQVLHRMTRAHPTAGNSSELHPATNVPDTPPLPLDAPSHEGGTPLRTIGGFSFKLKSDSNDDWENSGLGNSPESKDETQGNNDE